MSCRDNRCLTDLNRPSRNVIDDDEHSFDAIPDKDELSEEESDEEESDEEESDEDGSDEDALEEDVSNDEVSDEASSDDDYDAY